MFKVLVMKNKVAVFRKEHFNSAHRLNNPNWSDEKNAEIFGKCNNSNYHGHNYDLTVKVVGYPDEETGYVIDTKVLSNLIKRNVIDVFDHRNLNLDVKAFENLNPSAENIAMVIYNLLRKDIAAELDLKIILFETERNYVEYPA
jgi:6-pyruvoyltetrahydropterin/6-carboxytetrahydropterin synthase